MLCRSDTFSLPKVPNFFAASSWGWLTIRYIIFFFSVKVAEGLFCVKSNLYIGHFLCYVIRKNHGFVCNLVLLQIHTCSCILLSHISSTGGSKRLYIKSIFHRQVLFLSSAYQQITQKGGPFSSLFTLFI
jgi:hypothetical protein